MIRLKKLYQPKIFKNIKKRAVSPVIAVMLMIGLTAVSGALLFSISTSILNTETEVNLNIDENSLVFKSTETDYIYVDERIDTFSIPIENPQEEPILVDLSQTFIYNATDDSLLSNWGVVSDVSEIVLNGKESTTITFATDSRIYSAELKENDQVYVVFQSKLFGSQNKLTKQQTNTFTVELSNSNPLFHALPVISAGQTEDTLYFTGGNNEVVVQNLTLAIFNFGNTDQSYEKTVSITLENSTIFSIADGFEIQFVTVPSATKGGDFGEEGFCEDGEACVNVTIPIIKQNLADIGISSLATNSFGAIVSVSGLDFISYDLVLINPEFKIALKNKKKDGISFNTIIFDEKINKDADIYFKVRVWNLMDYANNGTFEIYDFNTTVFEFKTKSGKTDPNPTSLNFIAGPSEIFSECKSNDACEEISWGLRRNKLVDKDGTPLGIEAGTYTAKIRELRTGSITEINLIIPEYVQPIHVDDMFISKQKKDEVELTIVIKDSDGNKIKGAKVFVTMLMPDGSTETEKEKTNKNGEVDINFDTEDKGQYTFIITLVEKSSKKNIIYPYDVSANVIDTLIINI